MKFNILRGRGFWNWVYKYTYDGKIYKKLIIYTAPACTSSVFVFDDCTGPLSSSFPRYAIFSQLQHFTDISILMYVCMFKFPNASVILTSELILTDFSLLHIHRLYLIHVASLNFLFNFCNQDHSHYHNLLFHRIQLSFFGSFFSKIFSFCSLY